MVAGVDGCRAGWLVAFGPPFLFQLCKTWLEVAEQTRDCTSVAVDMPIGLPLEGQGRECDYLARRILGARRNSVFPAPARTYLEARSFSEVRGMSLQSFHLLPKIRELDDWIDPGLQSRVWEAHPELIFARLAGGPLEETKKSPVGFQRRLNLIGATELEMPWKRSLVAPDDYLDALALLICARHPGIVLGGSQKDSRGLLMQISG